MAANGPGITDVKILFARSGNRCAFPKCVATMAFNETLTGEVCHIKGVRPGSARYDAYQTNEQRHAYDNLILMCPTHHTVIDDDEEAYTVERLKKIKAQHEEQSKPLSDAEASVVAQLFVQALSNTGQSGGLSAHTVNASNITVQGAPSTGHLTHQRQIQAVENLWQVIRNLSSEFSLVIFVDTILTRQEIDSYFRFGKLSRIMDCVSDYRSPNLALEKFEKSGANDAARERPFVSHRLWSVFFVIQAIYARNGLLLTNSYKERKLVDWRDDSGCDQLLRAILPAQVVEYAKSLTIGGLRNAIDSLENQFLTEAGMNRRQEE